MKLSVIIPCYNCEKTIARVLDSIILQNYEDVEVIICDDNSNDATLSVCHEYDEKLNIVYCNTTGRGYHCPNNTRLDGLNTATGDWVTFIDDDDCFVENAFSEFIRAYNQESKKTDGIYPVVTSVCSVVDEDKNEEMNPIPANQSNCLHGKFFDRKFLYDNDLIFRENVLMQEDILFMNRIRAYCISYDIPFIMINSITYQWNVTDRTLSHWLDKYNIDTALFYLSDTIKANLWPYLEAWEKYHVESNRDALLRATSQILLGFYFTYMCLNYCQEDFNKYSKIYRLKIKEILTQIKRAFSATIDYIIYLAIEDLEVYETVRTTTQTRQQSKFIETKSFYHFITEIWNDQYDDEGHLQHGGTNE